jgi:hypothetical protein
MTASYTRSKCSNSVRTNKTFRSEESLSRKDQKWNESRNRKEQRFRHDDRYLTKVQRESEQSKHKRTTISARTITKREL